MNLIEKTINRLNSLGYTFFLDPKEVKDVTSHLKKNTYNIFKPFPDSEKNILYKNQLPDIILYEIKTPIKLRHQDILGTLYHLGIENNLFGDIVISNDHYYFYTFEYMQSYIEMELKRIKNVHIELIEKDLDYLSDFEPNFQEMKIITSSLRIDSVISKIANVNRNNVKDLIKDKKIIYNHDILKDNAKVMREGDTFSIRKIGKFKYAGIITNTRKDNLVLRILKYTSD